jgi:formylglycine-generating enzyme required for sulfatase activity
LDEYQIGKYEVTNRQYTLCVKAGICRSVPDLGIEKNLHPVVNVSWYDAKAYCEWVGGRLPTEAEWEKAASWDDGAKTKRTYPWGETINCTYANYKGKDGGNDPCVGDTMPVGSYESGKSPYGVYDMAGNVWEWVSSLRMPYPYDADDGREDMSSTDVRVLRDGSGDSYANFVRSAFRSGSYPTLNFNGVGFRCSRSP